MAWIQIRLNSTNEKAEKISDFLEEIGSSAVKIPEIFASTEFKPLFHNQKANQLHTIPR